MYKIYFSLAWFTSRSPDFERTALKSFVSALGLGAAKNGTQPPHLAPGSMRGRLYTGHFPFNFYLTLFDIKDLFVHEKKYIQYLGCVSPLKSEIGSKIRIIRIFHQETNDVSKKGLFSFICIETTHNIDGFLARITRLLIMLQNCWSFFVFWMLSSRIQLFDGPSEDESWNKIYILEK